MGNKLNVFLVDDDVFSRCYYRQLLENEGFSQITEIESGAELTDQLLDKPDIIFLDYNLADANGADLLELINQHSPETITVILSGQQDMDTTVQLLNNGAFDYVVKGNQDAQKIKTVCQRILSLTNGSEEAVSMFSPAYLVLKSKQKVREEFATELHDHINPLLAVSKLYLETALNNKTKQEDLIQESRNIILKTIQEIRTLSHQFPSDRKHSETLECRLHYFFELLQKQETIQFHIDADTAGLNNRFDEFEQHDFFLIVKELVNNLIKYSGSPEAEIKIEQKESEIYLLIKDYGTGLDLNSHSKGTGLTHLQQRLQRLKGKKLLVSKPGKGCCWHIHIPVKSNLSISTLKAI
ncbi:MAG TPA: response regulator [Lacibacter sp.]|nr:response regulator [Lacibacter sp.]